MQRIKNFLFDNQLVSGSMVMLGASVVTNFGNYLYHLLMGRMLGPRDYGSLNSLIAIFYLLAIPASVLITVVVKFTTLYRAQNNYLKVYSLFRSFSEKSLLAGGIIFLFFVLGRDLVANFLNIPEREAVVLVGSLFVFSLLGTANNGILQGFLNFNFLSANSILGILLKLSFAVFLVRMGLAVNGAILAILVSSVLPYFVSFYPLRFLWRYQSLKMKINWEEIFAYAGPVLLAVLGLTSLYSTDIILVKHFFPAFEAGLYAALSVVGKIIFFASSTIGIVMFPLVSEKFERGEPYRAIFYQAIIGVAASSVFLTLIYFSWPKLMMRLLYGSAYLEAASYLGFFAIFISLYSLVNILTQFFLSVRETKISLFSVGAGLLQGVLIWIFHKTLFQVIFISIFVSSLLLLVLLLYYFLKSDQRHLGKIQ